jgi:hypothetical protein
MKYETIPNVGSKTNRLIVHSQNETGNDNYDTPFPKLETVSGSLDPLLYRPSSKVVLPPTQEWEFDACSDFPEFRRNSYRGRRRMHAYFLAANYRKADVCLFEKWLNSEDQARLKLILDSLRALVQGVRVQFRLDEQIYYQMNYTLYHRINHYLRHIRDRTIQVNICRESDIPEAPTWTSDPLVPLNQCVYNHNDWEILAATYRSEVETFLQVCLYLGYDYQPVDINEPIESEEEEEEEVEEEETSSPSPQVSRTMTSDVFSIIQESMSQDKDKSKTSVRFEARSPSPSSPNKDSNTSQQPPVSLHPKEPVSILRSSRMDAANPAESPVAGPSHSQPAPTSLPVPFSTPPVATSTPSIQGPVDPASEVKQAKPLPDIPVDSNHPDNPFAPIDPVGQTNIVPSYQVEQVNRVYGAAPAAPIYSLKEHTGTERFQEMFKPSIYSQPVVNSPMSSPGAARAAYDNHSYPASSGRFSLPSATSTPNIQSGGAYGYAQPISPMSTPSYSSKGKGSYAGPPSGPPGPSGPPRPPNHGGGGGFPSGPPGGNGGGGFPSEPPGRPPNGPPGPNHPPHGGGGGDPPGGNPPDPPAGGAADPFINPRNNPHVQVGLNRWVNVRETHFDTKLKPDVVPTWDGEESTLGRWILQINELALRSESIFRGLGDVVPTRFRDKAAAWWYSLTDTHRIMVTQNWDTLKDEIRTYWMNQAWIDRTQRKAIRASYRDAGHPNETPTEYFIRKYELLSLVYNFTPSQVMAEVLTKAPRLWSTVLNPRSFTNLAQFQTAIKYHEDLLIDFGRKFDPKGNKASSRSYKVDTQRKPAPKDKKSKPKSARTYSIGSNLKKTPPHPKDDSNVSKGKTPADYGARGCIFCGSIKHWDRDCKYSSNKALHKARTMFVDYEPDDFYAEAEYDRCYYESIDSISEEANEADESELSEQEPGNSGQTDAPEDADNEDESDF